MACLTPTIQEEFGIKVSKSCSDVLGSWSFIYRVASEANPWRVSGLSELHLCHCPADEKIYACGDSVWVWIMSCSSNQGFPTFAQSDLLNKVHGTFENSYHPHVIWCLIFSNMLSGCNFKDCSKFSFLFFCLCQPSTCFRIFKGNFHIKDCFLLVFACTRFRISKWNFYIIMIVFYLCIVF